MKRPKYQIFTHDFDLNKWTPQKGVKCGPYALFGLRKAIRKLQAMGYEGTRDDPSVYVKRIEDSKQTRFA